MGALLLTVSVSAAAQPANITGLPPEALERLPAAARLFQIRNASAPPRISLDHDFVAGEVLARFFLELSDEEVEGVARNSGAHRVERLSPLGLFLLHGPPSPNAMERLMERLWGTWTVATIGANHIGEAAFVPNDPHFLNGNQWHLEASTDIDLDMEEAWDETRGSEEVCVAIVDSGIKVGHPEFVGRLYVNPGEIPGNGIDDDANGYIDDVSGWNSIPPINGDVNDTTLGHGTYVASLLLGNAQNSHQGVGIDHGVRFLPLKAIAADRARESELVAALDYLIANPDIADIVNLSVAHYSSTQNLGNALSAVAQNAILIGGSGNRRHLFGEGGADNEYPESHPDVITVGATDRNDELAYFSDTGNSLDFVAPGVEMYTASWEEPDSPTAFQVCEGTSMATPLASGTATLGKVIRTGMTKDELIFALKESSVDLGVPGWDPTFGHGRINTNGALRVLQSLIFINGFETGDLTAWSSSRP